jgi:diadenosine tetraphosphatase ApaH/serine/threonine PP2A family protein phosphatase
MKAIISDVHANLEALQAVLGDIGEAGIKDIYCLGDIVGYGPNPNEVLDLVMECCKVVILGNHDEAARLGPVGFTPAAARAVWWTRSQLQDTKVSARLGEKRWKYLANLPLTREEGDFLYVHASPRDPVREYIFPEAINDPGKMWDIFQRFKRCCFVGHTHIPGIFTESRDYLAPGEIDDKYPLKASRKILCNVGSVGQPRDGDWRACYVIVDAEAIHFRRIEYDIDKTIEKVKAHPELGNFVDK